MRKNVYTDLIDETRELYKELKKGEPDGIEVENCAFENISVTRVNILNAQGVENLGKPIGTYVTINMPQEKGDYSKLIEDCSAIVKNEIRNVIGEDTSQTVLIVGLGNCGVTPDSLGPKTVENIEVTRHLFGLIPDELRKGVRPVCSLIPGVLGTTGIETSEIIRGAVEHVKPHKIIAIDSLASRNVERIASTIQISNTGISPGAGVGNNRNVLNEQSLGVPVIAIGVPTVVSAKTLISDIAGITEIDDKFKDIIVTPKEIDEVIDMNAEIISAGINYALHDNNVTAT